MAFLYQPDSDPSRVYYGTDTRAAGFLMGAALALAWAPWQQNRVSRLDSRLLDLVGLGALALLAWATVWFHEFEPLLYQGGFALVGLATALAIAATVHPQAHLGASLLDRQPLRWIGLRSYSIYLWHWPVLMVTRPQLDVPIDGIPLLVMRLFVTGVLAELSFRFIEAPIRAGALGRAWEGWRQAQGAERCQEWRIHHRAVAHFGKRVRVSPQRLPPCQDRADVAFHRVRHDDDAVDRDAADIRDSVQAGLNG